MKTQGIVTLGAVVVLGSLAAVAVADPGDKQIDLGGISSPASGESAPSNSFLGPDLTDQMMTSNDLSIPVLPSDTEGNDKPTPPDPSMVPLPGPGAMGLLGLGVLAARRRRR